MSLRPVRYHRCFWSPCTSSSFSLLSGIVKRNCILGNMRLMRAHARFATAPVSYWMWYWKSTDGLSLHEQVFGVSLVYSLNSRRSWGLETKISCDWDVERGKSVYSTSTSVVILWSFVYWTILTVVLDREVWRILFMVDSASSARSSDSSRELATLRYLARLIAAVSSASSTWRL